MPESRATIDADEVSRFAALAETWWDESGPMAPLHTLNPLRIAFIRDALVSDAAGRRPLKGLRILDVGCGGGLLCEPLARLGAEVTGLDAAEQSIAVARAHAAGAGLDISYRHGDVTALAGETYDAVLAMEVVEHVADLPAFVAAAAARVAPGGILAMATLNRTLKALALAVVGAEYVLGWLPRGTHDWRKFVRPSELIGLASSAGLQVERIAGAAYNPLSGSWRLSRDLGVNYMLAARRSTSSTSA
jgi:2-polyprenyl-6-hydroxyphenyl methylase/3-demethylubiquinone-9 3-methyltransferase